jgi:hypothetical protein
MSSTPTGSRLRIGDAERDAAAASLGDHFAAGRLTREEFDERLDRAWSARTADELNPLFYDLPVSGDRRGAVRASQGQSVGFSGPTDGRVVGRRGPRIPPPLMFILAIALLITVITNLPYILIALGALWFFGIIGHRGRSRCSQRAQLR